MINSTPYPWSGAGPLVTVVGMLLWSVLEVETRQRMDSSLKGDTRAGEAVIC